MGEWDDPVLIGKVCDFALAELVVEASTLDESPESVAESWSALELIDAEAEVPAQLQEDTREYSVVEVRAGEILELGHDQPEPFLAPEHSSSISNGSDAPDSAIPKGRKQNSKQPWQPFSGAHSLANAARKSKQSRNRASLTKRLQTVPRTKTLPPVKASLTEILHKQPRIKPRPARMPKSNYSRHVRVSASLSGGGAIDAKKRGAGRGPRRQAGIHIAAAQENDNAWLLADAAATENMINGEGVQGASEQLPMECEGMPLMVGPDGEALSAVDDSITEHQLLKELAELEALRVAMAESGGRPSGMDTVAAAAAMAEVQERAMARLKAAADLDARMREAVAAVEASAMQVRQRLDAGGGGGGGGAGGAGFVSASEASAAHVVDLPDLSQHASGPQSIVDIAMLHTAIDQAAYFEAPASAANVRPAEARLALAGELTGESPSPDAFSVKSVGQQVDDSHTIAAASLAVMSVDGGEHVVQYVDARQQRSKHINEQLLRLHEESRRLQEQSRLLTERAVEMQRQAGLLVPAPSEQRLGKQAEEVAGQLNDGYDGGQDGVLSNEGVRQQDQGVVIREQPEDPSTAALAAGQARGADADVHGSVLPTVAPVVPTGDQASQGGMPAAPSLAQKGGGISWNMPQKPLMQQQQLLIGGKKKKTGAESNQQLIREASSKSFVQHKQRAGSADSTTDAPPLPSWSDLISSPITSPLKIVRKGMPNNYQGANDNKSLPSIQQPPQAIQWKVPVNPQTSTAAQTKYLPNTVLPAVQAPEASSSTVQPDDKPAPTSTDPDGSSAAAAAAAPKPRRFLPSIDFSAIHKNKHVSSQNKPLPPGPSSLLPQQIQQPLQQPYGAYSFYPKNQCLAPSTYSSKYLPGLHVNPIPHDAIGAVALRPPPQPPAMARYLMRKMLLQGASPPPLVSYPAFHQKAEQASAFVPAAYLEQHAVADAAIGRSPSSKDLGAEGSKAAVPSKQPKRLGAASARPAMPIKHHTSEPSPNPQSFASTLPPPSHLYGALEYAGWPGYGMHGMNHLAGMAAPYQLSHLPSQPLVPTTFHRFNQLDANPGSYMPLPHGMIENNVFWNVSSAPEISGSSVAAEPGQDELMRADVLQQQQHMSAMSPGDNSQLGYKPQQRRVAAAKGSAGPKRKDDDPQDSKPYFRLF
ncbi:hypothetical protein CEUSTIGMA_g13060.t1 [Chlamydomonas eustigma]|uniref:Uncharacterized protein n=1 Tax=Chlamydomonas eustigma TaxID=1157962 RepID=A0A250XRG7_9CHLO|nr:hypothetical protein CEUSTIGMA_g13060.t1 [Chlamydomonas eustigma]|eukprot:GAX85645.1 hypothetical protein CEUSTIGMA_g13060.t1 [Chlamydomonas eustigma]